MLNSLRAKILIPTIAVIAVLIAVLVVYTSIEFTDFNEYMIDNKLEMLSNSLNDFLKTSERATYAAALSLTANPDFVEVVRSEDTQRILEYLDPFIAKFDISYFTVANAEGIALARTADPGNFGQDISGVRSIRDAMNGLTTTSFGAGGALRVTCHTGSPVYDADGELVGVLSAGIRFDQDEIVDNLKDLLNAEITLFDGDERINTTVMQDGRRIVGTQMSPEVYSRVTTERAEFAGTASVLGVPFSAIYRPLLNIEGEPFATIFAGISRASLTDTTTVMIRNGIIIGVVGLLIAAAIVLFIATKISKPIATLSHMMEKVGETGDINLSPEEEFFIKKHINGKDETGHLVKGYNAFVEHVISVSKDLEVIASGDLSLDIHLQSEKDALAVSLKQMLEKLNIMFGEINTSASQVSEGSKQIADGAQSLAQGSTEQAASVEELSASISELSENTKENAEMAGRAATLADTIKSNAEKGNQQMSEMMDAVKEINAASQSINKVIKVIDDIAFQTNILALNAAVEAARAGQHGKGFAVVAEEVRNLAAKSAEAAKDTGGLIANSMEKADLGSRIAEDTASSLADIVSGINESSQLVADIAQSSEAQSQSIQQINSGVDQVAQVVQQNSATAQESAAASEEMSGQSTVLQNLISQFKLKSGGQGNFSLPAAARPKPTETYPDTFDASGDDFGKY